MATSILCKFCYKMGQILMQHTRTMEMFCMPAGWLAPYNYSAKIVDLSLASDVNTNQLGGIFGTALQTACQSGRESLVRCLLDRGAAIDVNQPLSHCGTALHAAAASGSTEIARLLMDRGADINVASGTHGTPILAAAAGGKPDIVKFLIDNGADIHAQCGRNGTVLQNAISAILKDFDVTAYDSLGQTENEGSSMKSDYSIAVDEQQYNATEEDWEEAETQYSNCTQSENSDDFENDVQLLKILINHGADINAVSLTFGTALCTAAFKGFQGIVDLVLQKGANVNLCAGEYETPLIAAIVGLSKLDFPEVADPDGSETDDFDFSEAEDHDRFEAVVRLLLRYGMDPNVRSEKYGTAMDVAMTGGWIYYTTKLLLVEHGATVSR